jgi:hypothetical protein
MSKSYLQSYTSVNGPSCSYAKLKTYANCARAEVRPAMPVAVAAPPAPVAVAKEGYLDPSPYSLPGSANTGVTNYTPSYNVPNYAPIDSNAFSATEGSCGGYKKILGAYNGMNGSSCTTNYINN